MRAAALWGLLAFIVSCQAQPREELVLWLAYRGAEATALTDAVRRVESRPR